jgi:hypothetical protein
MRLPAARKVTARVPAAGLDARLSSRAPAVRVTAGGVSGPLMGQLAAMRVGDRDGAKHPAARGERVSAGGGGQHGVRGADDDRRVQMPGDSQARISRPASGSYRCEALPDQVRQLMQRSISFATAAAGRGARARRALRALGRVLRGETGFPQADVDNEFLRARRRAAVARLACRVRGRPASASRLVPLEEVVGALGRRGERRLGLQSIRLVTIVGTLEPRNEFDHRFRPTSNRVRSRWERLALAQRRGEPIPPIEVYRVGDLHFVADGHHRVSIAAAARQESIDGYVTEVVTWAPARC